MSNFTELGLPPSLLKSLSALKFSTPTPIQAQAIPPGLQGKDILGLAQTGTGKTAAFAIPLLYRLNENPGKTALILAPTRELAQQIYLFCKSLAGQNLSLKPVLLIGGASMSQQLRELSNKPRVFIGTPGRVGDHLRRNPKLLSQCQALVLDEADRMLDMGFWPQIQQIERKLGSPRQTFLFSATLAPSVRMLAIQLLKDPVEVTVGPVAKPIAKIEQVTIETTHKAKNDILLDELNQREGPVLIFMRTQKRTERLYRFLVDYGYKVSLIHGARTQGQRQKAMSGFRSGLFRILVATDIAARGLDIVDIAHVINYDLPMMAEDYVHRIGRTGRNGRTGESLSLLTPEDRKQWRSIERLIQV